MIHQMNTNDEIYRSLMETYVDDEIPKWVKRPRDASHSAGDETPSAGDETTSADEQQDGTPSADGY